MGFHEQWIAKPLLIIAYLRIFAILYDTTLNE